MKICFWGVGGVGGYYGALLTKYVDETGLAGTYFIASEYHAGNRINRKSLKNKAARQYN